MTRYGLVRDWITRPVTFQRSLGAVVCTCGAATALRWLFGESATPVPFATYYPAIVLCTLMAGWRAGTACLVVSVVVVNRVFLEERFWQTWDLRAAGTLAIFFASCALLIAITQTLRSNFARLQLATAEAEYLNEELVHRFRNLLAIVNSIAVQTFKAEPDDFPKAFAKRMTALSSGLNLLATGCRTGFDLRTAVEASSRPFQHRSCISVIGASRTLPSHFCVPLTLAIHELCTNSVKYGALSVETGKIRIELEAGESCDEVLIRWTEVDGPRVHEPTRTGLGSALLRHPLLGPAELDFNPAGLRCRMRLRGALAS